MLKHLLGGCLLEDLGPKAVALVDRPMNATEEFNPSHDVWYLGGYQAVITTEFSVGV